MRRHQPSLPNKTPFVPLFFSLAWVTSVSVGLACWPLSLSLAHSSPLAPKLVVDHWIYALKRRGERRSKAPRFLVFLRFDKHTTTHHGSMHPWLFVLFIHPYTPAVPYPKLPTPSFRSLLPFYFQSRIGKDNHTCRPWVYESVVCHVTFTHARQWCACNELGNKSPSPQHHRRRDRGECVACLIIKG